MTGEAAETAVVDTAVALARELSDPVRLVALQVLASEGPRTAGRLADELRVTAPRLGNHLARLREAGLVSVEHTGRHAIYSLASPAVAEVLSTLFRYAGATPARAPASPIDLARTCYDHTAGLLGVNLFAHLVGRGALRPPDGRTDELRLGAEPAAWHDLGVDPSALDAGRRKPAVACLDRTYRLPHLGGHLGSALLDALLAAGSVRRRPGTRALVVTPRGARHLAAFLPDDLPDGLPAGRG